jgi:hypothetical protein
VAKIIEAKAVISAEDRTGAVFDRIAKKIDSIAKNAKTSKNVDALAKSLERAQKQMAAIDRFGASKDGFAAARSRFREAQAAVESAARAMKRGEGDARALQRTYESTQQAVTRAAAAFERQKTAVLQAKHGLEQLGIPAARAATAQDRLRAAVERTNLALEKQPSKFRRAVGAAGRGVSNGMMLAGPGILHVTKEAAKSGAEIQSELVKMRAAGIPETDIQRASTEAGDLTAKYTNVKRSDALERFKELRSIMLNPEEAHSMLPIFVQATSAMNAIDRTGESAKGLNFAARGAEVLGLGQNEERMRAYVNSFIKAQQVMGETITPEMQYELAKYARASGATLSDRFKLTTGLSLSQELGGSSAGKAVDQFVKQITGGFQGNNHSAAKEFVAMGLASKNDFDATKTGEIKGLKPGHKLPGWKVAQSDPDRYVYDYLLPAFERNHITDQDAQIAQVRRMFPAGNAADLVVKLLQQRQSYENHAKLYGEAKGLDAANGTNNQDPFVALNSLTTSLSNFAGVLTQPSMQSAAGALDYMASSLGGWQNELSKWAQANPNAAKWAGGGALAAGVGGGVIASGMLVSNLFSGFGLGASATALDGSAAALSTAAAELSAAAGAGAATKGGSAAAAAGGLGSSIWKYGVAGAPYVAGAAVLGAGLWGLHENVVDNHFEGMSLNDRLRATGGSPTIRGAYRRAFLQDEFGSSPEVTPTTTYGTGVGGDKSVAVSGTVTGEGKMAIEVNAGSSLIDVVNRAEAAIRLAGTVNSNGPGSLGQSSPDANAPPPTTGNKPVSK